MKSRPNADILYYADIHAPEARQARGIERNFSSAGTSKVLGIAQGLNQMGYNVTVISPASVCERTGRVHRRFEEAIAGEAPLTRVISVCNIDNRLLRPFWSFFSVTREIHLVLKARRPDFAIIYNISLESIAVAIFARLRGVTVVLEYEDSVTSFRTGGGFGLKKFFRIYEIIFGLLAAIVLAPSQTLISRIGSRKYVHVAGVLGPDISKNDSVRSKIPAPTRLPAKLIYAGGIDRSKGIIDFVDMLELVDRNIELDIYGGGPEVTVLEAAIGRSRHTIRVHGMVPRVELLDALRQADIAVDPHNPDMHAGGSWPFKVIEYLGTCGTVVTSSYRDSPADIRPYLLPLTILDQEVCAREIANYIDMIEDLRESRGQRISVAHEFYSAASVASRIMSVVQTLIE